jgi:hypothetical protein
MMRSKLSYSMGSRRPFWIRLRWNTPLRSLESNWKRALRRQPNLSSSQILVYANDATILNTLPSAANRSAVERLRRTVGRGMVSLGDGPFFAMSVPITGGNTEPAISLTVLKSYGSALAALDESKHLLVALGIGALAIGGLFVYVIADRPNRPSGCAGRDCGR